MINNNKIFSLVLTGIISLTIAIGMASIFKVRKGLVDAIKVLRKTQVGSSQKNIPLNERNIPAKAINMFSAIAIILVGGVYFYITNNIVIAAFTTIIMIIMAFLYYFLR